jgi:hypothetical protein
MSAEGPIIFSAPMDQAILAGRKTQTRRLIRLARPAHDVRFTGASPRNGRQIWTALSDDGERNIGYCEPGDRLWVRETWRAWKHDRDALDHIWYRADDTKRVIPDSKAAGKFVVGKFDRWHPAIHMPRWVSRLTLEVAAVRAERPQDISDEDARAEGVVLKEKALNLGAASGAPHRLQFFHLWEAINGKRAPWAENPWVWVVSFCPGGTDPGEPSPAAGQQRGETGR